MSIVQLCSVSQLDPAWNGGGDCCCLQLGSTAIGIQTSERVCLAVEKRITSPLMEPSSIEKIVEIDSHIGKEKCTSAAPRDTHPIVVVCKYVQ